MRLLDLIVKPGAVKYIPDGTRARLFRHAAKKVAEAKNSIYDWGHSNVHNVLRPLIDCLDSSSVLKLAKLFANNRRVQAELHQRRPNIEVCSLLDEMKEKVTFEINKKENRQNKEYCFKYD